MLPLIWPLFAPAVAQAAPAASGQAQLVQLLITTAMVVGLFYLLLIRPERERRRKLQALVSGLKKNDRVWTAAGITGTVHSVNPETDRLVLRIDDEKGVKLTCLLSTVVRVEPAGGDKGAEASKSSN